MSKTTRKLHKETFTAVGTGLLVNYPLNMILLYWFLDVLQWTDTVIIATSITGLMTFVAYTRVYIIRRHFHNKDNT